MEDLRCPFRFGIRFSAPHKRGQGELCIKEECAMWIVPDENIGKPFCAFTANGRELLRKMARGID